MTIYGLGEHVPNFSSSEPIFIAPNASVIGDVQFGIDVSVWFNAVIRADNETITIGDHSNIQDSAVAHCDPGAPLIIGKDVTIGHKAVVHGCRIDDGALIGIGAIILNNAHIGSESLIGAGCLISENKIIPEGVLVLGQPGRIVRALKPEERLKLRASARQYVENALRFKNKLFRIP